MSGVERLVSGGCTPRCSFDPYTLQQRRAGWRPCYKSELSPGVDDVSTRYKVRLNRNDSSLRYLIRSEQYDKRIPDPVLSKEVTGTALARFQEVYGSRKILCSRTVREAKRGRGWHRGQDVVRYKQKLMI